MTLTKKSLQKWQEGMHVSMSEAQKAAILKQFGTEPEPWVWSEQDISEQIRNYLQCGHFEKPRVANAEPDRLPCDLGF